MNCTDPVRDRLVEVTNQTGVTSNQAAVAASLSRDRNALLVSAMKLPKPIRERPSIAGSPRPGSASRRSPPVPRSAPHRKHVGGLVRGEHTGADHRMGHAVCALH
jgi:hypothetical protein